jgi:hypothetical protein
MDPRQRSSTASRPQQTPAKVIRGQYLAKARVNYRSWQRALDAALWLKGQLTIEPTIRLAAKTFGVDVRKVVEARDQLERREQGKRHAVNGGTVSLSDSAIENIVREVGIDRVWRAVEKLTQPELPLVAAE